MGGRWAGMFHKNVTISGSRASGLGLEPGKMGLGGQTAGGCRPHGNGHEGADGGTCFFKQVSAGVSNGVRIKGGGAAPEGRVCLRREIRFGSLNGVTE